MILTPLTFIELRPVAAKKYLKNEQLSKVFFFYFKMKEGDSVGPLNSAPCLLNDDFKKRNKNRN